MANGTVAVRFTGDISDLESKVGAVGSKLEQFSGKMMSVGSKMSLGITGPLALLGKVSVDAASDLNESQSKVQVVFGKSAAAIEKFADGAAKNMGMSRQQALDMAGSFGNMFTQLGIGTDRAADMSQQMGLLAADLASFHNADISEVIEAQSAAFRGEYDSVQKFVPTINAAAVEQKALAMGLGDANGELTDQAKALAVQQLLTEGAGKATGDFARTADGLANSQRIAAAEAANATTTLGQGLQPIMQKVTEVASGLAEKFAGLSSGWQNAIVIGGMLLFALGPLVTVIGAITAAVGALSGVMAFLAANPVVLVILAVAALVAGLVIAYQKSETFRDIVNGAFDAVGRAAGVLKDVAITAFQSLLDFWLGTAEWIVKGAATAFGWVPGIGGKLKAAAKAIEEFRDDANRALDGIKDKTITIKLNKVAADKMADNFGVPNSVPKFADGGVMPGPRGVHSLAWVAGGETILPTHKGGSGGASTTIVIPKLSGGERLDPDAVYEALVKAERMRGPLQVRIAA